MHRVVLWVEQGRQVVDSQLVCTTPAAGLRVMLANHSREAAAVLLLSEIGTFLCRSLAVYTIQDERFAPFINYGRGQSITPRFGWLPTVRCFFTCNFCPPRHDMRLLRSVCNNPNCRGWVFALWKYTIRKQVVLRLWAGRSCDW